MRKRKKIWHYFFCFSDSLARLIRREPFILKRVPHMFLFLIEKKASDVFE